jgi:AraC-like DNA-binding protein
MKIGPRPILVLHGSEPLRDRLRALSGRDFTFRPVADWAALAEAAREAPPSAVAVVDPTCGEGAWVSRELRLLVADFPSLPVFAAAEVTAGWAARYDALRVAGVAGVIAIGHDDSPAALREHFRLVHGRSLKRLLARVLPPGMPERAEAIVDVAADVVARGGYGRDVAGALRTSRRTLLRWLYRSGLPCARHLLAWFRVLQAAELLDDPGRTVFSVARACGYASDPGLRRVMQRFLGMSPTELRRRGAFRIASRAFRDVLADRAPERPLATPPSCARPPRRARPLAHLFHP